MATDTILVHESIAHDLITRLSAAAERFPASWAVSDEQAMKTEELVRDAVAKGARFAFGKLERQGSSLHPTILLGVNQSMRLFSEESFGPTLAVLTFESEDAAVDLANSHEYGLSASVFTRNVARGIRMARAIHSGAVHINSMTIHDEVQLPHGGMKSSGWGRFGVPWGELLVQLNLLLQELTHKAAFDEFLQLKTITVADDDLRT